MAIPREQKEAEINFMLGHGPKPNVKRLMYYEIPIFWGLIKLKIKPKYGYPIDWDELKDVQEGGGRKP